MKKAMRVLLALCMVFALLPANAFAAPAGVSTVDELTAALEQGGEITLAAPIDNVGNIEITGGKEVTLNLNGNNLTLTPGCNISVIHGKLTLTGTGKIVASRGNSGYPAAIRIVGSTDDVADYSVVTIGENVSVQMADSYGGAIFASKGTNAAYGAKLIVNGAIDSMYGFSINGLVTTTSGTNFPEVRVNPTGRITGSSGIYGAGYGLYNIYGSLIGNEEFGIEVRAGKLNVYDGATITCSAPFAPPQSNGNGSTVTGAAIAVSQHATNLPIDVNIQGGTITETGKGGHALYEIDTVKGEAPEDVAKGVSVTVTGGTFGGPIHSTNKNLAVSNGSFTHDPSEYVTADAANATLTRKDSTSYLVGAAITNTKYEASDKLTIESGNVTLTDLPNGVTVANNGTGTVTVNDVPVKDTPVVSHTHTFDTNWTFDETNHWHACTDPACDTVADLSAHSFTETITTAASCTTEGKATYTCACGYSYEQAIPATGHTLSAVEEVPATETTEGVKAHWVCKDCGKLFADAEGKQEVTTADLVLPKLSHTHKLTAVKEVPATTTKNGVKAYWICEDCGKLFADAEGKQEVTMADLVLPKLPAPTTPQTGDSMSVMLYTGMLILAVLGLVFAAHSKVSYKGKRSK